jgi:glycosyltransferase involved in cell wall biosynthesis
MIAFITRLIEAGCVVKFWPDNLHYDPTYTPVLQKLGVEVLYGPKWAGRFREYIEENGPEFHAVLLSRPHISEKYVEEIRAATSARIAYYGHDLHFRRVELEGRILGDASEGAEAARVERQERDLWRKVDVVLYPSQDEVDEVLSLEPQVTAHAISPYAFESFVRPSGVGGRRNLIFVAGFAHTPNVDAAKWLVEEIMPKVWQRLPSVEVSLVGSHPTSEVLALAGNRVEVTGYVSDAELARRYSGARVAVVPLRFGAGIKSKVVEALQQGLPLVTTGIGAQGLPALDRVCDVANEADSIAERIVELMLDDNRWLHNAQAGADYVANIFSKQAMSRTLQDALGLSSGVTP